MCWPGMAASSTGSPAAARTGAAAAEGIMMRARAGRVTMPAGVAARDHHARLRGDGQPVTAAPAQHAGDRAVGDPARGVDPADPVDHMGTTPGRRPADGQWQRPVVPYRSSMRGKAALLRAAPRLTRRPPQSAQRQLRRWLPRATCGCA